MDRNSAMFRVRSPYLYMRGTRFLIYILSQEGISGKAPFIHRLTQYPFDF